MTLTTPVCRLCCAGPEQQSIRNEIVYAGTSEQKFWQCSACDAIYLFPPTTEGEDAHFYETSFDKWMSTRSGDDSWSDPATQFLSLKKREEHLRVPWLRELAKPGQRILEIGCSSGFTLALLKEWGCDCVGLELNQEYVHYARSKGLSVYSRWDDLRQGEQSPFDLVLHYYVLEHVPRPLEFLRNCFEFVKEGGTMLFEVPNGDDALSSLYQIPAFNAFYWWRAHHWYFTRKSLGYLLGQLGRSHEIHPGQRYDLSNHLHWMLTGKPGGMGKYAHIFSKQTETSYAEDLKRHYLCDYLVALVR